MKNNFISKVCYGKREETRGEEEGIEREKGGREEGRGNKKRKSNEKEGRRRMQNLIDLRGKKKAP